MDQYLRERYESAMRAKSGKKCALSGCSSPSYGRGHCIKHYTRLRKHGDPTVVLDRKTDPAKRFWKRVNKNGPLILDTRCWVWTSPSKLLVGYGRLKVNGKEIYAHRFSYELHHGKLGPGEFVCHKCDNGHCINPTHLFAGTAADNMADCKAKGRLGRRPGWVPKETLKEIRTRYLRGGVTQRQLADEYGLSQKTVMRAVARA